MLIGAFRKRELANVRDSGLALRCDRRHYVGEGTGYSCLRTPVGGGRVEGDILPTKVIIIAKDNFTVGLS